MHCVSLDIWCFFPHPENTTIATRYLDNLSLASVNLVSVFNCSTPYCTVVLMMQTKKVSGMRPHLVLACGCEPEPEDNWQADRRCWTPCRRPAGQPRRGQCCWCRIAAGSCSSASEGRETYKILSVLCHFESVMQLRYAFGAIFLQW